jgi:hypothetical protein
MTASFDQHDRCAVNVYLDDKVIDTRVAAAVAETESRLKRALSQVSGSIRGDQDEAAVQHRGACLTWRIYHDRAELRRGLALLDTVRASTHLGLHLRMWLAGYRHRQP